MAKTKTKRNEGRSPARRDFTIRKDPMARLAEYGLLPHGSDPTGPTRECGQQFLFAIARDESTIFVSWNIDWRFVFEKAMPVDRQVHLRLIDPGGVIETKVAVEPMSAMHYLTISGVQDSYRVDIGYFQPYDTWHSVAMSDAIEMPSQTSGLADVDLATIPFHVSFQQLNNLFGTPNGSSLARVASEFQKRLLSRDKPDEPTSTESEILQKLNLSLPEIAAAERDFRKVDSEKLARHTRPIFQVGATSPAQGFQVNPGS